MTNKSKQSGVGDENGMLETGMQSVPNTCSVITPKRWKQGMTTKYCHKCRTLKTVGEFFKRTPPRKGFQSSCKKCRTNRQLALRQDPEWRRRANEISLDYRRRNKEKVKVWDKKSQLRMKYGMTLNELNERLHRQNHRCMICREAFQPKKSKSACVDHNHTTKQVRDILCSRCNSIIGYAEENPEILQSAIDYLQKWKA